MEHEGTLGLNIEPRTLNLEHRTSNLEHRTSNIEQKGVSRAELDNLGRRAADSPPCL
jgi:hypothetical protein